MAENGSLFFFFRWAASIQGPTKTLAPHKKLPARASAQGARIVLPGNLVQRGATHGVQGLFGLGVGRNGRPGLVLQLFVTFLGVSSEEALLS